MIYITSDLHLNHTNIIKYNDRPFDNVINMNTIIINNINKIVKPSDDLYILGDFCFGDRDITNKFLDQIICKNIYLIKGNHDSFIRDRSNIIIKFKWIKDYFELKYNGYTIIMFHYPISIWNKKHHGSIHLYGHCHSNEAGRTMPSECMLNAYNVNCELYNYMPISIDTFIKQSDPHINDISR